MSMGLASKIVGWCVTLGRESVASCTCGTKPPDIQHHASDCKYRLIVEAERALEMLRRKLEEKPHGPAHTG